MTNAAARKLVASVFAKAGHKGQAGSPLSASTLFNWQANLDDFGREFVDRTLGEWRSSPSWPPGVADAEAFVRRKAEHPIISFAMAK